MYSAHYDFDRQSLLQQRGGFEYRSKCNCWAIGLDIEKTTDNEIRYQLRYRLLGSGDDALRSNSFSSSGDVGNF
jgi:hypothetical protein